MAFLNKLNIPTTIESIVEELLKKGQGEIGSVQKFIKTDYGNLIEKLAGMRLSQLGTPVYDHVTFYLDGFSQYKSDGSENTMKSGQTNLAKKQIETGFNVAENSYDRKRDYEKLKNVFSKDEPLYLFTLDNVIINVNLNKLLTRTQIIGESGSIKEYTGDDDYSINFTATIAGANMYQEDVILLKQLDAIATQKSVVNVSSLYLNSIFGIDKIVISDVSINQDSTYSNMSSITINAYSDYDKKFVVPFKKV